MPNDQEILFFALLVNAKRESVAEQDSWVSDVLEHESAYQQQGAAWQPPSDWLCKGNQVAPIYEPVANAYGSGTNDLLDQIGKSMQMVEHAGQIDGLNHSRLRKHFEMTQKDKRNPPRWKSLMALFGVARLLHNHGREHRKLLGTEAPLEQLPTAVERAAAAEKARAAAEAQARREKLALEKQVGEATRRARKSEDAHRHAAKRLQLKLKAVSDARKDERKKAAARTKAERAAATARAREARARVAAELKEKAEAAAEQKLDTQFIRLKAQVARARARARATEAAAKQSAKRLRRA
eukprot:5142869-Prymnesium_polylepis.1